MLNKSLTFQTNTSSCMDLEIIIDDSVLENSEAFQIAVSSSDPNVTLGSNSTASITIVDNDSTWFIP